MTDNRRESNALIAEHNHLNLTEQETYRDPFTGEQRIGSSLRDYYANEAGEVVSMPHDTGQDLRSQLETQGFRAMPEVKITEDR